MDVRAWQPSDAPEIVTLIGTAFRSPMNEDIWRWYHPDHPAGGPLTAAAWDGNRVANQRACCAPLWWMARYDHVAPR